MTPAFSAVYYSHGKAPLQLRQRCAAVASAAVARAGGELVTVTWEPLSAWGLDAVASHSLVWPQHVATHESLYRQILAGVAAAAADIICLVEHDVLYPAGYFEAMAAAAAAHPGKLVYNRNVYGLDAQGYFAPRYQCNMLSNLCATKATLAHWLKSKVDEIVRTGDVATAEPGGDADVMLITAPVPTIDVRHYSNFTGGAREALARTGELDYWGAAGRWLPMKLRLFLLSQRQDILDAAPVSPHFHKINLSALPLGRYQSNLLGEGRAFLYDLDDGGAEYLGCINARWDAKYPGLSTRLVNLVDNAEPLLAPDVVLAPWPTESSYWGTDWYSQALQCHPSMADVLHELAAFTALKLDSGLPSLWANDFICHRGVWYAWRQFWRRCFNHFHGRYGFLLPYRAAGMDVSRMPAYFYERVTTIYFANRGDLRIVRLP